MRDDCALIYLTVTRFCYIIEYGLKYIPQIKARQDMALWIILLITIITVFVAVHAVLLPKLFLKVRYAYKNIPDRGLKVVDEANGRSIVYEPDESIKDFINQYIVSERDGKKSFVCKIDGDIRFIDFDIVLFNEKGVSFKVLNVKEIIKNKGYTEVVPLPDKTVYVTVVLNRVNDSHRENRASKHVVLKGVALYILSCALIEILCVFGIKACIGKIYGGLFFESFMYIADTWIFTAVVCAGVIILNVLFTVAVVFIKKKNKKKGEANG